MQARGFFFLKKLILPKKFQNFSQIYTRKQDFLKKIPIFVSKRETLNANWALNRPDSWFKQTNKKLARTGTGSSIRFNN